MAIPSVTYSFTNGTTSDATQVNQNFTDLIASLTDGTKSLTIDALTANGAVILKGAVTLGDGTPDDITFTGSLASTIPIKTNNSFNIGSSTLGLASVYLGSAGGFTTRVVGGATTSYTMTLPVAVPTVAKSVMTFDTSGVGTFEQRGTTAIRSAAVTDTVLSSDELLVYSGASFTGTLPAASAALSGKVIAFLHDDSTLGRVYTITDGTLTKKIATQGERLRVYCNGTAWKVLDRYIPSTTTTVTPTGSWIANTTYTGNYYRDKEFMVMQVKVLATGTPTSATLTVTIPTGLTIATSKLISTDGENKLGLGGILDSGTAGFDCQVTYNSTTSVKFITLTGLTTTIIRSNGEVTQASPMTWTTNDALVATFRVPITDWEG